MVSIKVGLACEIEGKESLGIERMKMKNALAALIMFFAGLASPAGEAAASGILSDSGERRVEAESKLEVEITIPELVEYAYAKNSEIVAAREAWKAAVEKYGVSTALPDPQISVTYFPEPIETSLGPQDWNASVSQTIPFPGKLSKEGEIVEAEAQIAKLNLDRAVRDVAAAISQSYHELLYIQEARRVAQLNANLLDELRKFGETAYARDKAAFLDIVKSQSQVAQISYDIILLDELEMTEKTKLNGLLNRPPDAVLGVAKPVEVKEVVYEESELYEMARKNREEIRVAEAAIRMAEAQVDLAKYKSLPEFNVGFYYSGVGDPDVATPPEDAGEDSYGVRFGMSVPLWFGKNSSRAAEARAKAKKARAERNSRVNETHAQIRTLYFKLSNSKRLIDLYSDQMMPQALKSVQTAETWFKKGEGGFSDFVEAQKTAYDFQLSLARARADYGKNLADLERVVGEIITGEYKPSAPESEKP